ncbi:MAG TPA: EpsI family protein [Pyrinomonadaceae bacterium]|nr:EpsI family protein [Pyrinomonadaceae bacterium]
MRSQGKHFWLLLALLVAGGAVVNFWSAAGEARVARAPLATLPAEVGGWRQAGADSRFDKAIEEVLAADDYVARDYRSPDGRLASLYVGYYKTQRTGATYHSPLNCLPGSGWTMSEAGTVEIKPADGGSSFEANRYIVEHGQDRQLLVYWYQGRGRAVANEYWDKVYTVLDSIRLRRSDGAMVRVLVPVRGSEEQALETARAFAAQLAPGLPAHVPD